MVVPRTSPRWVVGLTGLSARGVRATTRTRSWQQIQRRTYAASEGHGSTHKSSSDLPWAIGSAIVTVPSVVYLLQSSPDKHHDHGHHEGKHEEHEGGDADKDQPEGEADDGKLGSGTETQEGEASEGTSDNGSTTSGSGEQPRPDHTVYDAGQGPSGSSRDEDVEYDEDDEDSIHEVDGGEDVEGVRFKGATRGTKKGERGDTRLHVPDAKGGAKRRIQSHYAKPKGAASDDDDRETSKGASNVRSETQGGISNADTKHSTDLDTNPAKSKKGEGFVETAKTIGPVDPARPQV
ncbi:MAG: hypothetical protein Q9196_001936 [Gyalolechia fulgens]